jgi:hypothetical protein
MSRTKPGGSIANATGSILENFVENTLKTRGYEFVDKKKFKIALSLNQKIYTTQFHLAETIYGSKWNIDFVLHNPKQPPISLIIECKWQQVGGSVDEKYPYVVANIKEQSPYPAIILLDGEGYKAGSKEWLKKQVDNKKLLGVFNMGEFTKWANLGNI